jgi:hypothetical protein
MRSHSIRRAAWLAPVALLALAACGGAGEAASDKPASGINAETTEAPLTTAAETTTEAPTTTDAPTTTAAPTTTEAPTTTAAPTTTIPAGSQISRETALAANRCIELWHDVQGDGQVLGFYTMPELQDAKAACDEAHAQLEVDLVGAPVGPLPARQLAVLLSEMAIKFGFEAMNEVINGCPTVGDTCDVPAEARESFLNLDPNIAPAGFTGRPLLTPTVDNIDGLTVAA